VISQNLIKLASQTKYYGLPNNSKFRSTQKNKICGDIITIEVEIINQLIKKINYETESCVFCQASASVLASTFKNMKIKNANKELSNFLKIDDKNKIIIKTKFKEIKKLLNNKYKERYNCVILPINTLLKAINC